MEFDVEVEQMELKKIRRQDTEVTVAVVKLSGTMADLTIKTEPDTVSGLNPGEKLTVTFRNTNKTIAEALEEKN